MSKPIASRGKKSLRTTASASGVSEPSAKCDRSSKKSRVGNNLGNEIEQSETHVERKNKETRMPFALWQNLRPRLEWIYEGRPRFQHDSGGLRTSLTLWCLRRGQVSLLCDNLPEIVVHQGWWVLLPPGEDKRHFSDDAEILSVFFDVQWSTGENWLDLTTPLVFEPEQARGWYRAALPMLRTIRRYFASASNKLPTVSTSFLDYARLQGHFLLWLNALVSRVAERGVRTRSLLIEDDRALRIHEYLDSFPLHRPFRVEQLAKAFGLSVSQLGRVYHAQFGHGLREHFESRRLRYARTLLIESNSLIKEIAFSLGFKYTSQFSSWFHAHAGCSPLQYRRGKMQKEAAR